jgi:penicillin-binding protein 1C
MLRFKPSKKTLVAVILIVAVLTTLRLYEKPALSSLIPHSTAIYAADATLLRLTLASDAQYQLWAPLQDINANAAEAVKLYEDRYLLW